jgi:hypothetical protein
MADIKATDGTTVVKDEKADMFKNITAAFAPRKICNMFQTFQRKEKHI